MNQEIALMVLFIERIVQDILAQLDGLSDAQLNMPPAFGDANSLYAIATHVVGMGEYWTLALVGGQTIARDRDAEFRAKGNGHELCERFQLWVSDCHRILNQIPHNALDEIVEPPAAFRTTGGFAITQLTKRECLLHVIEHSATHLGQIQITRQALLHF